MERISAYDLAALEPCVAEHVHRLEGSTFRVAGEEVLRLRRE
jgi:hypothetical protein